MIVWRAVHRIEVAHRDARIARLEDELFEARRQLNLLVDQALARAGAIQGPTMRRVEPPKNDAAALIASAMGITEIDSSLKAPHAS